MATRNELLNALNPDYLSWVRVKANAWRKVANLLQQAVQGGWNTGRFVREIEGLRSYDTWLGGGSADDPPGEEPPLEEEMIEEPPPVVTISEPTSEGDDIRDILLEFLRSNELPESLMGFINDALAQGMSATELIARLRETPEYIAAYPENAVRAQNGFSWIPEAQIRAMRDEINRITESVIGIRLSNPEIAGIIGQDKSLSEWEQQLRDYQTFQRWGPTVQAVLEQELGYLIPDERAFALLSLELPTPELDRAYEMALLRGQPAMLGIGVRPDEEAELLRRYGISVDQAFRGYQGIVSEMPRTERLAAIEAEITRNIEQFPPTTALFADTSFATLFRAIQLNDPEAISSLQAQLAREVARFQAGGAPAGAGLGLLSPEERATR